MNFDYIQDAEPKTEELKNLYAALYHEIERAEEIYWSKPQKCGSVLQKATEKICQIYNAYYEIGYPASATLEEYLCYTNDTNHNVMVSKFLSAVRQEQRDRLEWLRVWGDECVFWDENPMEIQKNEDKLYVTVKKMMIYMLDATREMCKKLNNMTDLEDWIFEDDVLPGYMTEEEHQRQEKQQKKEKKKSRNPFFRKKQP